MASYHDVWWQAMSRTCKWFLITLVDAFVNMVWKLVLKGMGWFVKIERRKWENIILVWDGGGIGEVEEYKYLGVPVKAGLKGDFKSMGDIMMAADGVLMVNMR